MNWKTIRLELGRTTDFPDGSVSRAFLLRVPLNECGKIDEPAIAGNPGQATVRRFWPSQPDRSGRVVRHEADWAFRFPSAKADSLFLIDDCPFAPGAEVRVRELGGITMPFRVASFTQLR